MNKKKLILINTILIFLIMFISHNLYNWFENNLFAIFFPVNESIWEHMKMIYTTIILFSVVELILFKKFKIEYNNLLLSAYITSITTIIIELIIFIPIYKIIGENLPITLITLFVSIFIGQIVNYCIQNKSYIKHSNIISIILIVITFIIMGYLTYKPPRCFLFFDPIEEKYGINIYTL